MRMFPRQYSMSLRCLRAAAAIETVGRVLPRHPWTNGQVERMNRTIKEATVKRFFYDTHEHLKAHLSDFIAAYNFARRLKTTWPLLSGRYER
jgi:transposase InsO family protein